MTEATAEAADDAEEEQPPIEEEEQADIDFEELAEEVEEETAPESEEETDGDGETPEDGQGIPGDLDGAPSGEGGKWGEMYVGVCTTATNAIIEEFGEPDAETVTEDHFTEQIPLDRYFNETLREMGHNDDMPPQQALVVGTILAIGGPVLMETDLLSHAIGEVNGDV